MNNIKIVLQNLKNRIDKSNPSLIAFSLFILLYSFSMFLNKMHPLTCDMAEYLNNPYRILNGDLPYRDFWLLFTPGEVYFPALIYKIFGLNTNNVIIATTVFSNLIVFIIFYLIKNLTGKNHIALIGTLLFFFTSVVYLYEEPGYLQGYAVCGLVALFVLLKFFNTSDKKLLFIGGLFLGGALFFRLYESGAYIAAGYISLLVFLFQTKSNQIESTKSLMLFTVGIMFSVLCFLLPFYSILPKMFTEVIFESVKNGTSMNLPYFHQLNLVLYSLSCDIQDLQNHFSPKFLFMFFYHCLRLLQSNYFYLLPFVSSIILFLFLKSKPEKKKSIIAITLFLFGMFALPKGLGRSDLAHLAPCVSILTLFILFIYYYFSTIKTTKFNFYIISTFFALSFINLASPIFDIINYKKSKPIIINYPHGKISFKDQSDAKNFTATLDYIQKNSTSNDYIFCTIWDSPPIYTLSDRKNPSYYDSMNDLVIRPSDAKQIELCNRLKSSNTKIIIHNGDWGYDDKPEQQFKIACRILNEYIDKNYTLVQKEGQYGIYIRK